MAEANTLPILAPLDTSPSPIPKPSPLKMSTNTPSPNLKRKSSLKASQAKFTPSPKPRRSRFSVLRKSKRPNRLKRIDSQIEARIKSEARYVLEIGVTRLLVAREVNRLAKMMKVSMSPITSLLLWVLNRQLRELEVADEPLKKEWQRIQFNGQRNLKRLSREEFAFRQALLTRQLPKWDSNGSEQMITRMVAENETKARLEFLTSFDYERDELVTADAVVTNLGSNLGCLLACVRKSNVDLRFSRDIVRGEAGQVKEACLKVESLRSIDDCLKEFMGVEGTSLLSITTSGKASGKNGRIVGAGVGQWAKRARKEIVALELIQSASRMFVARKIVEHRKLRLKSAICLQNSAARVYLAKQKRKYLKSKHVLKVQTNSIFGAASANNGLNALMGRTLLTPIDPLNMANVEVIEALSRVHGGSKLMELGLGPCLVAALHKTVSGGVNSVDNQALRLSLLKTLCVCLGEKESRQHLLKQGAGLVLHAVWSRCLIDDYASALACLRATSYLVAACSADEVSSLFTSPPTDLSKLLVAMIGSDPAVEGDTAARMCGTASCLTLDILQKLLKEDNLRLHLRASTQVIPLLMGTLRVLAEKNEHVDHQLTFCSGSGPIDPLGSVNYFALPEIASTPKHSKYPKFKYRPSYSAVGLEEDAHNLSLAEEWSALRCARSQPLVLERCAVLLWTFAREEAAWVSIHREGGVLLCCQLLRCSLWPLAARLGCILACELSRPSRQAKLAFMQAGVHRLLHQHLLLGHHEVRPAAQQALELLSETLRPLEGEEAKRTELLEQEGLWDDIAVGLSDTDMSAFLSGWSSGSTNLNYNEAHVFQRQAANERNKREVEWKERWTDRATGLKKPAYS